MPINVTCGLSKKIGMPDFGSLGASCEIAFEVDRSQLETNLDQFRSVVRSVFRQCQEAVEEQLSNQAPMRRSETPTTMEVPQGLVKVIDPQPNAVTQLPASLPAPVRHVGSITTSQLRAIRAIARRVQTNALELIRVRFGKSSLEELDIRQASDVIDELKRGVGA
ncbi:MAG: hypothetical protein J0M26_18095 [Planctomycetes bacterium]|nr:hypothetical protein [Planctomycetota bacterium]